MHVTVLGAGGLLGHACVEAFSEQHEVVGYPREACDITSLSQTQIAVRGSDLVINCAAYTDADSAEAEPGVAWAVNALGAANVAIACHDANAILIHISTDSVFDGESPIPYAENSLRFPISVYGNSKFEGECQVEALDHIMHGSSYIVRVQGLYGDHGQNFASRIVQLIQQQRPFHVDNERLTQPTWATAAADQILKMVEWCEPGTYHVSCRGETTWAGFAKAAAEELGLPVCWEEVPTVVLGLPARRPKNCTFAHQALGAAYKMPDWRDTLKMYLKERGHAHR